MCEIWGNILWSAQAISVLESLRICQPIDTKGHQARVNSTRSYYRDLSSAYDSAWSTVYAHPADFALEYLPFRWSRIDSKPSLSRSS